MDVKENLAKNLVVCRKSLNLTQAELAEKLNYSDKSVSKWERGEAVPDLTVLHELSKLYGISIDTLISSQFDKKPITLKNIPKKRFIISGAALGGIWLLVILAFCFVGVIFPDFMHKSWLAFIIAIPLSFLVILIFTSIWGKHILNLIFTSLFAWTFIGALYIVLAVCLINPPNTLWLIYLVGVPTQVLLLLFFFYKKVK